MGQCMFPIIKKDEKNSAGLALPCGRCPECLKSRTSAWSFRLRQEEKRSTSAHFVTLTYDTHHVPITSNGYMSLRKSDLQNFFKRLRKLHFKHDGNYDRKIKYYACGEYGDTKARPHYHIILFNSTTDIIEQAWSLKGYRLGEIHIGTVSEASVGYTLKYICKESRVPQHRNDDRLPEFPLMSKRLGDNYLTDAIRTYHHADLENRMYIPIENNQKIAMPRYYKQKLYTDEQRQQIGENVKAKMQIQIDNLHKQFGVLEYARATQNKRQDTLKKYYQKQREKRQKSGL